MDRPELKRCRTAGSRVSVRSLSACPLLAAGWVAAWRPGLKLWTGWNSEDAEPLGRAFLLATSSACPLLCLSFVVSFVGGSDDSWVSRVEALNRLDPCADFVSNRRLSS